MRSPRSFLRLRLSEKKHLFFDIWIDYWEWTGKQQTRGVCFGSIRFYSVLFAPSEGRERIFLRREEDAKLCVRNMESQDRRLAGFWVNDPGVSRGFPGCRLFHGILAK